MSDGELPRGDLPAPMAESFGDFQRALFEQTPRVWVTPALLALNVAVFLVMIVSGVSVMNPSSNELLRWGADFGPSVTTGHQPWRLLTNTFLHIGAVHLIMNMIGLWQIGPLVERLLGNVGFAVMYLLAGLGGSLLSLAVHPFTLSAGASGAIFGVYGALISYLLRHRGSVPTATLAALQKSAIVFIGFNVLYGFRAKGIDMSAHIGGLLTGAVVGLAVASPLGAPSKRRGAMAGRAAAIGLALVAGATMLLPRTTDLAAEFAAFGPIETQVLATYNDSVQKVRQHTLTDEAWARIIDEQVLPPWRAFRRRFNAHEKVAASQEAVASELSSYLAAREEAWTAIVKALGSGDMAALEAANQTLHEKLGKLSILQTEEKPGSGSSSAAQPAPDVTSP
jgi:rhomboid protease GluP